MLPTAALADEETGPGRFQGALTALVSHNNNYYYTAGNEASVTAALLRPEFKFKAESSETILDLTGAAEYETSTAPGAKDNYLDRRAGLDLGWTPTYRNRFFINGGLQHGHDPYGTLRTSGTTTFTQDLDEWNHNTAGAHYRYGSPDARVNAEIGASLLDATYTTNRAATDVLDYKAKTVDYSLIYNATPKTSAVLSFSRGSFDFDKPFDLNGDGIQNDVDTRSGNLYQIRFGARWLATAKTAGDVRAGYRQRTFENLPQSLEGFDWQASVDWNPVVPWLIKLKTARSEDESYVTAASTIDTRSNTLSFRHVVSQRAQLTLDLDQARQDFFGFSRRDQTRRGALGLEYAASRSLSLLGSFDYGMRESTDPSVDYHRMGFFLGIRLGQLR